MQNAVLCRVVTVLAVVVAVQLLPGSVGRTGYGRLSGSAGDLRHMKMKEGDVIHLPHVDDAIALPAGTSH